LEEVSAYEVVPFLASDLHDLPRDKAVPEMHDRIIVGVSRRRGAALITKDKEIIESNAVKTVW
jgi:PIN domain nuclease of toxin-antitoxin system